MAKAPLIDVRGADVEFNMPPCLTAFQAAANQYATGTGGATTVATADADANSPNVISQVTVSFDAAPAAGSYVQVQDGSTVVWKMFLAILAGPQQFLFSRPMAGTVNTAMTVTVSDPGGTVHVTLFADIYRHK